MLIYFILQGNMEFVFWALITIILFFKVTWNLYFEKSKQKPKVFKYTSKSCDHSVYSLYYINHSF